MAPTTGGVKKPHRYRPGTVALRGFDDEMRAVAARNLEGRGIHVHAQTTLSELRKMLDLLVHASQCRSAHCQYPNCRKVKGLFRHGIQCKTRAYGGCVLCKKMWYLLQLHARACKESECHVPRCRDLIEHSATSLLRLLQLEANDGKNVNIHEYSGFKYNE